MFFVLSKLAWMALGPITLMLLLGLAGGVLLFFGRVGLGRIFVVAGFGLLLLCGILPLGALLLRVLEDRFPPLAADAPAPVGIIVLGGSTDPALSAARGRVAIPEAAERLTEAVILARRYPEARLVFSGGSASLRGVTFTEAQDARALWTALGVDAARITTEDRSRNTDENVRFSKRLVDPRPGERWILVTSAYHMPRAVGLFAANGWPVLPDPVDYRTFGTGADFRPETDILHGVTRFTIAVREWLGLVVYAATGRTQRIFPGPQDTLAP